MKHISLKVRLVVALVVLTLLGLSSLVAAGNVNTDVIISTGAAGSPDPVGSHGTVACTVGAYSATGAPLTYA
jgi:hypothetical protein